MAPGPLDGLPWIAMGTLAIVFRRHFAEKKPLPWARATDQILGVDVRVFSQVLVGVIAIVGGLTVLLIWALPVG